MWMMVRQSFGSMRTTMMVDRKAGQEYERRLKTLLRSELPKHVFERNPWRILWAVPFVVGLAGGTVFLGSLEMPWYLAVACSIVLGNFYVAFMFFGHESAHGGIIRSRRVQTLLLYFTHGIFLIPPHLWRFWHNDAHHAHTNIAGVDPDSFGLAEHPSNTKGVSAWVKVRLCPGSRHWLSILYLPLAFTLQGQCVLWTHRHEPAFRRMNWQRAVVESALMLFFWCAAGAALGPSGSLYGIILPMIVANIVVMSYVATNHLLHPLVDHPDNVTTTLGVTTFRLLDAIHLHFSHHLEHHLFPSVSHRYYPLIRDSARRHAPDKYLAPSHWRVLRLLLSTPRFYAGPEILVNPLTGTQYEIGRIHDLLRADESDHASAEHP